MIKNLSINALAIKERLRRISSLYWLWRNIATKNDKNASLPQSATVRTIVLSVSSPLSWMEFRDREQNEALLIQAKALGTEVLGCVQGRQTELEKVLKHKCCKEQLRELVLFILKKRRFKGSLSLFANTWKEVLVWWEFSYFQVTNSGKRDRDSAKGNFSPDVLQLC